MDLLLLTAITDGHPTAACAFTVAIDGGLPVPASTDIPGPASVTLPDGAQRIVITATPASPDLWPLQGEFVLLAPGILAATNAPAEFETPRGVSVVGSGLILVTAHLTRVRDVTDRALASLTPVPPVRASSVPAVWPPPAWDAPPLAAINTIGGEDEPVAAGNLKIVPMALAPSTENLVLELKNVVAPQTLAVSWPSGVTRTETAGPTPFLLYFHANAGQNAKVDPRDPGSPYYIHPQMDTYPFGFDYVYFGLWRYMNYPDDPLTKDPYAKGLPYQMDASGKDAVIVLPCNRVGSEVGVFLSAASAEQILREVQAFMFRRAGVFTPPALGRVALASFSAGNELVTTFLSRPANQAHAFYLDSLQEVYMFDIAKKSVGTWLAQAQAWAGRGTNATKMIRAYTQYAVDGYASLLNRSQPAAPFVATSADDLRTAAVLPGEAWNRAAKAAGAPSMAKDGNFQDTHQLIPALMLTDALRRSGF